MDVNNLLQRFVKKSIGIGMRNSATLSFRQLTDWSFRPNEALVIVGSFYTRTSFNNGSKA